MRAVETADPGARPFGRVAIGGALSATGAPARARGRVKVQLINGFAWIK